MILHNLKMAVRNLMKYKIQTVISVVCIAVGIVTLSIAHSFLNNYQLSSLYELPYSDRIYNLTFKSINSDEKANVNIDIVRAIKKGKELKSVERIAVPTGGRSGTRTEFHLPDSTVRKGFIVTECVDPEFLDLAGFTSAITGKRITELKRGEAIVGEKLAKDIFGKKTPIGTVQEKTGPVQPIPIRIVDVYKSMPSFNLPSSQDEVLFSLSDKIEDQENDVFFLIPWIHVVLKEGFSEATLLQEINEAVKPLGFETEIEKAFKEEDIRNHFSYKLLIYLIGSLILIAAIIGYLRTQLQLFWSRRSEMTLRIVNGAHKSQLIGMFLAEASITIIIAVMFAIVLGYSLQDIFKDLFPPRITIGHLWLFSVEIGCILILAASLIAWLTLERISKSSKGLVRNIRGWNNHLFQDAMLCMQIIICTIIICTTLLLVKVGHSMLKNCNIPDNDEVYSECLFFRTDLIEDHERIEKVFQGIRQLPEFEDLILFEPGRLGIEKIGRNPEAREKFNYNSSARSYKTNDKDAPTFFGMDIEWFSKGIDRNECILVGENLYKNMTGIGLLGDNTMTILCGGPAFTLTLPIAGIVKNVLYEQDTDCIVPISKYWEKMYLMYVVIPKKGKGKSLAQSVEKLMYILDPENIWGKSLLMNYRDTINITPSTVKAVYVSCVILSIVSLLICAMSIFSSVTLDTRSRKKEVAIRKVNGAKNKDIYKVLGLQYLVVVGISLMVAIPSIVLLKHFLEPHLGVRLELDNVSPTMPIVIGCLIVIVLISMIVWLQIRKIISINTYKIISKE